MHERAKLTQKAVKLLQQHRITAGCEIVTKIESFVYVGINCSSFLWQCNNHFLIIQTWCRSHIHLEYLFGRKTVWARMPSGYHISYLVRSPGPHWRQFQLVTRLDRKSEGTECLVVSSHVPTLKHNIKQRLITQKRLFVYFLKHLKEPILCYKLLFHFMF